MILSRTSQYAIQALIFVATQPRGVPVLIHTLTVDGIAATPVKIGTALPPHLPELLKQLRRNASLLRRDAGS